MFIHRNTLFMILWWVAAASTAAASGDETDHRQQFQLNIKKSPVPIVIDGIIDEAWLEADIARDFINKWPVDSGLAEVQTEVRLSYDDNFMYVLAVCHTSSEPVVQTLRRDDAGGHWRSDAFTIMLDPINKRTNGFLFGVTAGGAQIEAQLTIPSNRTVMDENWDNKWYSEVSALEDRYIIEMAIPFKTLRYNTTNTTWGLNFVRNDMKNNVYSTWSQVPQGFGGIDLAYNGALVWDVPPAEARGKVVLIPYVSGGLSQDYEEEESLDPDVNAGLDAKIQLTSSLNLDLTVNPDFSNVDVDQQITNLSRFSIFFPERRNFFLENSDLFANFGNRGVRPFFSRRIGIHDGEPVPIIAGARVSGNLTDDLRIGVMDIQTNKTPEYAAQNYFVAAVQQRVFKNSRIKSIFINRQATSEVIHNGERIEKDYNRNAGLEFQYISKNSRFNVNARAHTSWTQDKFDDRSFLSLSTVYSGSNLRTGVAVDRIGENYIADVGFTPRLENYNAALDTTVRIGYYNINPWIGYLFRPADSKLNFHGPWFWTVLNYNVDGSFSERRTNFDYEISFKSGGWFFLEVADREVQLPFETELLGDEYTPLPSDRYHFNFARVTYESDRRKLFSWRVATGYGSFYTGRRLEMQTTLSYRIQPWVNMSVNYTQNRVDLGDEFGDVTFHLVSPMVQVSFNNRMFWTTFLQFNTQGENFNINSRFQWRFRPMSDLFIVYSENYTSSGLEAKNRGIVFKLTYWINM